MFHDFIRQHVHWDAHLHKVFGFHGGVKIEIFEVIHHATCIVGEHHAVEQDFGSREVGGFGDDAADIMHAITTNGLLDPFAVFFLGWWAHNVQIHFFGASWKVADRNEMYGVGARDCVSAFCKAMYC